MWVTGLSGGVEVTACDPRTVAALERSGFVIDKEERENPVHTVRFSEEAAPVKCFSKLFDDPSNPKKQFAAVMTCSDADEACPVVFGAAERISVPYTDPKEFDGTEKESEAYAERCRQISSEMLYVFSLVAEAQAGQ